MQSRRSMPSGIVELFEETCLTVQRLTEHLVTIYTRGKAAIAEHPTSRSTTQTIPKQLTARYRELVEIAPRQ